MIDKNNVPQHVAIIMDGNGRWAKARGLPRTDGHREGIKRIEEILKGAQDLGIKYLTLFAFSLENWKRPKYEVQALMRALDSYISRRLAQLQKNNVRLVVIGQREPVPDYLWKKLLKAQSQTQGNSGLTVILAFNYGSRQEIVDAARRIAEAVLGEKMRLQDLNEEVFSEFLYTRGIPDPDLLIRTSAQQRMSNFLLWQASYTELYFPKVYWPDFKREDLEEAVREYQKRERRFGAL